MMLSISDRSVWFSEALQVVKTLSITHTIYTCSAPSFSPESFLFFWEERLWTECPPILTPCEQLPLPLRVSPLLEKSGEMILWTGLAHRGMTMSAVFEWQQFQEANTTSEVVRKLFSFLRRFIWQERKWCSWPCNISGYWLHHAILLHQEELLSTVCCSTVGCGFCKILLIFFPTLYSVCWKVNNVNLFDKFPHIPTLLCC